MLSEDLTRRFTLPANEFGPTPLWWWSGDEVTSEKLRWQMRRFKDGGVVNLVIINLAPTGPQYASVTDRPAWFSEAWWARFLETCEIASELEMKIWFYDQLGFSGANLPGLIKREHPWAAGSRIRSTTLEAMVLSELDPARFLGAFDDTEAQFGLVELAAAKAAGLPVQVVTTEPTAFDYLNPRATALLFDRIHGEFERRASEYLGTVIVGSFQDELPAMNNWAADLPERFREQHGYDLLEVLPALFLKGGDKSARVRSDYYATRTRMAESAFFRPLGEWHDTRGMLLGCDQASPARSGYPTQSTQLYSDYFRTHRWYSAAGSDHMGDSKVHSSMAHLYGHERVWLEAFHSSGWGGSLEETYDWLLPFLLSGANLFNPHASYFGTFGGWFEWAAPSTDWRQPYWGQYPAFSEAVARLCSVLTWGDYDCEVGVLHPSAVTQALVPLNVPPTTFGATDLGDAFAEVDRAQETYLAICGENNWFDTRVGALDAAGVAFDVVDDHSLQNAVVSGGAMRVRGQAYRSIVLPAAAVLEFGTAKALLALLESGGNLLVVGASPRLTVGHEADDAILQELTAHARLIRAATPDEAAAILNRMSTKPTSDVPLLIRRRGDEAVALVTGAFPSASVTLERPSFMRRDLDYDRARYAKRRTLSVPGPVIEAQLWNPATGARSQAAFAFDGARTAIEVNLDGAPAALVTWREGVVDARPIIAEPLGFEGASLELSDFTGALIPTLDNRWGDLARPVGAPVADLQIWSMDWAEGPTLPAVWTEAKVTFGQRVRTLGPLAAEAAPAPLTPSAVAQIAKGERSLCDATWKGVLYSASRGLEREAGRLGTKGILHEEFVRTKTSGAGDVVVVRALIGGAPAGVAELIVGAGADKRVWWNGDEVTASGDYLCRAQIIVRKGLNVLEYQLGASENYERPLAVIYGSLPLGSFFTLAPPGGFSSYPQLIRPDRELTELTTLRFQRDFQVVDGLQDCRLIVGAHGSVTVLIDGKVIAEQPKSEWYEDALGAIPMFSEHTGLEVLTVGQHSLELRLLAPPHAPFVYADLALSYADRTEAIATDGLWAEVSSGPSPVQVLRGHHGEMHHARAARRSHPLPGGTWLRGSPEVGTQPLAFEATDDAAASAQWFRILLPAGAVEVTTPLKLDFNAECDAQFTREADRLTFAEPLSQATLLTLRTAPTVFARGGAAWVGPLVVKVDAAPIALGDWREIGLSAWSGGVSYRRRIDPNGLSGALELDLGNVRGAVEVWIDGKISATLFCPPFRLGLGDRPGPFDLEIRVFNTLGPFLHESTPTLSVLHGQLVSGLIGPVILKSQPT